MSRNILKRILLMFMMIAISVFVAGCTTFDNFKAEFITGENEDVVRIGVFEPLSGTDKEKAAKEIEGIELAYGMYPTADGKKIELIYADNRSDIDAAETAIQDLIKKNPKVILGSYGNANTLVASEYIEEAKIPSITMTNTNPIITSTTEFYFRVCYVDTYQGTALADYAYHGLGLESVSILSPSDDEQAAAIVQRFISRFIQLTGKDSSIGVNVEYESGSIDYSEQLQRIKDSGSKVVLLPASMDDAEVILKQADELKIDVKFMGIDTWDAEALVKAAGEDIVKRAVFTKITDIELPETDSKATRKFLDAYQNIYGADEIPDSATALGYDAYIIAIKAIEAAGSDSDGNAVRNAILESKGYRGATGNISFNKKGDPKKSVTIYSFNEQTNEIDPIYIVNEDGTGVEVKEKRK